MTAAEHDQADAVACIVYGRKSTDDPHGSIPDQISRCREHAAREGWHVVAEYHDEARSAYHDVAREGFDRAREHAAAIAAAGGEAVLLAYQADRLTRGRGRRHLVALMLDADDAGYRLAAVVDDPRDVLYAAILGERAHADSKAKAAWTKAGQRRAVSAGRHMGPHPPLGYLHVGERSARRLMPNEREARIVRRIFAEYAAGAGRDAIADRLNAERVPTRRGGPWLTSTIGRVLDNPVYAGLVHLSGETFPGQHEPLIDRETFDRVQRLRSSRREHSARGRLPSGRHLLTRGMLRCGSCGAAMIPRVWQQPKGGIGEAYRCSTRNRSADTCSQRPVPRQLIDSALLDYCEHAVLDLDAARAALAHASEQRAADAVQLAAEARATVADLDAQHARMEGHFRTGELLPADYYRLTADIESEREAAEAEAAQLTAHADAIRGEAAAVDHDAELLAGLVELRAAVAGTVQRSQPVDALRAAIAATFDHFALVTVEGEPPVLVPVVRPDAVAALAERIGEPLNGLVEPIPRRVTLDVSRSRTHCTTPSASTQ